MANTVLLNNRDHADLRVITARSADYGDDVMLALTFPAEFRSVQAHYPIVFRKSAEGQFQPVALFGLRDRQNLFLTAAGWDASYVPLMIERQPFLVGVASGEAMIHVDLDSPRISRTAGEPVFLPHGGTTVYLDRMSSILRAIHEAAEATPAFVATLVEHALLEPFVFDFALADGSRLRLTSFHTINEERLRELPGEVLERLSRAGYLQAIYMVLASLSHLR
ncbi:MAG TPA: SapC family protein, partial [Povalibacter sp.]|nr:SapC family protein [Povalibacter sp.]